jgi:Ca2+/H+ antiporter, TMEM165/GDT1 family
MKLSNIKYNSRTLKIMNMNRRFGPRKVLGILLLVIIGVLVFGSIVMVLWNGLMPQIFHLPLIGFWQALGLFALAKILFSGFRGGPRGFGSRWKRDGLREGWANMTAEQQEKFKQEWGRRCGRPFPPEPNPAETK